MERTLTDLRLGCAPDLPLQRLQSLLGALYAGAPDCQVEVLHLRTSDQLARLAVGELDAGLIHDPGESPVEMAALFPGEPLGVVAPINHLIDGPPPPPLARQTLRVFPRAVDPELHDRLLAAVAGAGHVFGAVLETGGPDIRDVLVSVAESGGVALAARSTLELVGELGAIVAWKALDPPVLMPATMIAWGAPARPSLEPQLAAAREAVRELREEWDGLSG